jgi:hypothetical protein
MVSSAASNAVERTSGESLPELVPMVSTTMPCDARKSPQFAIELSGETKPGTMAMAVKGGSASFGYQSVWVPYSGGSLIPLMVLCTLYGPFLPADWAVGSGPRMKLLPGTVPPAPASVPPLPATAVPPAPASVPPLPATAMPLAPATAMPPLPATAIPPVPAKPVPPVTIELPPLPE